VQFVAIDMSTVFKAAVRAALPHATLVVDHFHVVQLANAAVTEVRRRLTIQHRGRRRRKGSREWELRNRLTRSASRTHGDHLYSMIDDLTCLGALGEQILTAWNAKEDLLDVLGMARTRPDRAVLSQRLHRFYTRCAHSGLPELERLATTVETWWPQILAFIHTGISNAVRRHQPYDQDNRPQHVLFGQIRWLVHRVEDRPARLTLVDSAATVRPTLSHLLCLYVGLCQSRPLHGSPL
jgi:transposase